MSLVHQTIRTVFCVIVSGKIIKTNTRQCYEIEITGRVNRENTKYDEILQT